MTDIAQTIAELSGSTRGTLLVEQMVDGAEDFSSENRVPENAVWVAQPHGGPLVRRLVKVESDGCMQCDIGYCSDLWGWPMFSYGCASDEMMMMSFTND